MKSSALLAGIMILFSCEENEKVILPVNQNITESVYASGNVESKNQYTAFATASGIVNKIYLSEGEDVVNGSPILSISNIAQQLNQDNAKLIANFNNLSTNQGKLTQAFQAIHLAKLNMKEDSLNYSRQKQLFEKNVNAKIDLESAFLHYQNSMLSYTSAKTNYSDLKRQLDLNAKQAKNNLQIVRRQLNIFYKFPTLKVLLS